jgi:hypothetical protein
MKLNGSYQLLVYADVVKLLGDNIDAIKEKLNCKNKFVKVLYFSIRGKTLKCHLFISSLNNSVTIRSIKTLRSITATA